MNRFFFLFLLVFFSTGTHAQTVVDTTEIRFSYDARLRVVKNKKKTVDEHYLDIGKHGVTKYYSRWDALMRHISDSVFSHGGNATDFSKIMKEREYPTSRFDYYIFKNCPEKEKQTIIYISLQNYTYTEETGQQWDLLEGDTLILDYTCYKARTTYHGRTWNVWYTPEIPIQEGPWKLCGLPGLILAAYDTEYNFSFECMGIYPQTNEPMTMSDRKYTQVTPKKLENYIREYYANSTKMLEAQLGGSFQINDQRGRSIQIPSREPVLIEIYE